MLYWNQVLNGWWPSNFQVGNSRISTSCCVFAPVDSMVTMLDIVNIQKVVNGLYTVVILQCPWRTIPGDTSSRWVASIAVQTSKNNRTLISFFHTQFLRCYCEMWRRLCFLWHAQAISGVESACCPRERRRKLHWWVTNLWHAQGVGSACCSRERWLIQQSMVRHSWGFRIHHWIRWQLWVTGRRHWIWHIGSSVISMIFQDLK